MIIGHARHGKDTVAELLAETYRLRFNSSSRAVCREHIYPVLAKFYPDADTCYNDRVNCRDLWAALIRDYCTPNKAKLAELIFKTNDLYVGCRDYHEFAAIRTMFDPYVIWVDARHRKPLEPESSMKLTPSLAHLYIDNNDTLDRLKANVELMGPEILKACERSSDLE